MSLDRLNRRTWLLAAGAGALSSSPLWAQSNKYPVRNIRMIVPFPATGGPDTVGRLVALMLSQKWGQQIVVENMPGASGQIGTNHVVKAPADGYTLLFAPPTPITIAQQFDPKPAYDPTKDLVPASLMGRNPAVIVTAPLLRPPFFRPHPARSQSRNDAARQVRRFRRPDWRWQ